MHKCTTFKYKQCINIILIVCTIKHCFLYYLLFGFKFVFSWNWLECFLLLNDSLLSFSPHTFHLNVLFSISEVYTISKVPWALRKSSQIAFSFSHECTVVIIINLCVFWLDFIFYVALIIVFCEPISYWVCNATNISIHAFQWMVRKIV